MNRRGLCLGLVATMLVACSDSDVGTAVTAGESTEADDTAVADTHGGIPTTGDSSGSVLDLLDADQRGALSDPQQALVDLLVQPSALGHFMLVQYEAIDPNGDGTIGDRWYRPEVVHATCSVKIDSPTLPTAVAVFIPGSPEELKYLDNPLSATRARMEADLIVTVQVAVFDTSQQRDDFADANEEIMVFVNDPCAATEDDVSTPGPEEFEPPDVGYPGAGFAGQMMIASGVTVLYRVGERVLLTVSAGQFLGGQDATVDDLTAALEATIDRLVAAGLG